MPKLKPVLLVVLDGFGLRAARENNAIAIAGTPNLDALIREFPHTAVETSGLSVGLPEGQMGNSEVGHLNLGAGRIVYQDLTAHQQGDRGRLLLPEQRPCSMACLTRPRPAAARSTSWGSVSDGGVHATPTTSSRCLELARSARG